MRTRMSRTGTIGMAGAILLALSSTLSAQYAESLGGATSASSTQVGASSASLGTADADLSGDDMIHVVPLTTGWCGTDTTPPQSPALARFRAQLFAALFHSGLQLGPAQVIAKALAFRRWYQSSIDVAPYV